MKPAIAKLWTEALRSRKYKQTSHSLREGNAFCCLGVLCNLHALEHPGVAAKQRDDSYCGSDDVLPSNVMKWAGMKTFEGTLPAEHRYNSLIEANDSGGCTFGQIAKIIEENVNFL